MNESANNQIFRTSIVAIYALLGGKLSKFWKCAGVKYLKNMMSSGDRLSPFCDSYQHFNLGLGEKNKLDAILIMTDFFTSVCLLWI